MNRENLVLNEDGTAVLGVTNPIDIEKVSIPEGVRSINASAFSDCEKLSSVDIPEGVIEIGARAFYRCPIEKVELPSTLTTIQEEAFRRSGVRKLDIPSGVVDIPERMCQECLNLTEIRLSPDTRSIGYAAFSQTGLARISLPEGLETIGSSAFYRTPLQEITLPDSLAFLGASAFEKTKLKKVKLSERLESIEDSTFAFTCFSTIEIPSSVTKIGERAFAWSGLEHIRIPENVRDMSEPDIFCGSKIKDIVFLGRIEKLGDNMFDYCQELTEVELPASVKMIGKRFFSNSMNLKTVKFNSRMEIGADMFYHEMRERFPQPIERILIPRGTARYYREMMLKVGNIYDGEPCLLPYINLLEEC